MTSPLQMDVSWDGVVVTVTVTGELDIAAARALRHRLLEVASAHPERLVLDLGGLVFVDAAGAKALDDTCKLLEAGCPVIVRRPPARSGKIFGPTGLTEARSAPASGGDLPSRLRTARARAAASYERTRELWQRTEGMQPGHQPRVRRPLQQFRSGPAGPELLQRSAHARLVARL